MKKLLILLAIIGGTALTACTYQAENSEETIDQNGKEYTSAYICPMHCKGSGSESAGTCPVCKMDYVENKSTKKEATNSHGHEHHYTCSAHPEVGGHQGDSCTQCGNPLTLTENQE